MRTISERMSKQYDAVDRALLLKAKAKYARRYEPRPWLFWLSLAFYVSAVLTAFWVAYRALAGWPVDGVSLLSRVAG